MLRVANPAMWAASLTGLRTITQRLVDDRLDGARTTATFGAAPEAAIDLLGIAQRVVSSADGMADIVVAEDVAGTDDHEDLKNTFCEVAPPIWEGVVRCKGKSRLLK